MVWFRVDDNLAFHPKVMEAGNNAMGLWVRAGAWSSSNLTDGFIPTRIALRLGSRKACYSLVNAGLFEEKIDGFQFHDWNAKNFTKQQVELRREDDRKRKADQRKRHLTAVQDKESGHGVTHGVTPNGISSDVTQGLCAESAISLPYPALPSSNYVGEVSPVGVPAPTKPPPPKFCLDHPQGTRAPCTACQAYRKQYEAWEVACTQSHRNRVKAFRQEILDCPDCDDKGWIETRDGAVSRCPRHDWAAHA